MINLQLEENEAQAIVAVLGDLPTKSNAWPLVANIVRQLEAQKETEEDQNAEADR